MLRHTGTYLGRSPSTDSLAASVERHEMSDPEAMRQWVQYRNSMMLADAQIGAQESATRAAWASANAASQQAAAARQPVTCTRIGNMTTCN
jgi:hypothetical protein